MHGDDGTLLPVATAQRLVLDAVQALDSEDVPLLAALGRALAEEVHAPHDVPQEENSAMDGYAVRVADTAGATPEHPRTLEVIGEVRAGSVPAAPLRERTAIRIMTGALIPPGADAVIPVEQTDGGTERVALFGAVNAGTNIRRRGEDIVRGSIVGAPGTLLQPADLAVLATAQRSTLRVARRPRVAILSTGDELIDPDDTLTRGKIVNSNAFALASLATAAGAEVVQTTQVADSLPATAAAIEAAVDGADIVLSSGGVSVGAYDHVKEALRSLGATTLLWRVAMKPGKPLVVATLRDRLFFGLPGNPVSCMVSFHLFVAPALRRAQGMTRNLFPPMLKARLTEGFTSRSDRPNYLRVRLTVEHGKVVARPRRAQGSGISSSMLGANGLAVIPPGHHELFEGETIDVLVIGSLDSE